MFLAQERHRLGCIYDVTDNNNSFLSTEHSVYEKAMVPQQTQLAAGSPSPVRQQQLLEYLQQQRILLQRQQEQLKNLLPPISQSIPAPHTEIATPNPNPRVLAPSTLVSSPQSPPPTSTRRQFASLHDGWSERQHPQLDPDHTQPDEQEDQAMIYDRDEKITTGASGSSLPLSKTLEDDMPSTSDFVKKLYRSIGCSVFRLLIPHTAFIECLKTRVSSPLYVGGRWGIVSS